MCVYILNFIIKFYLSSAYKNCEAVKNTNKNNMDKIKNKQTEEIIQTKHKQLQSQETLNKKQIEEHKQDTTTLKENINKLQLEVPEIKKSYAEATANRETTHKQNKNTTLQKMEKEVTDLKTLIHMCQSGMCPDTFNYASPKLRYK